MGTRILSQLNASGIDGAVLSGLSLRLVQATNQISLIHLSPGLDSGVVQKVITSDLLHSTTTAALHGDELAVINGKFDTGFPPTVDHYEAVVLPARQIDGPDAVTRVVIASGPVTPPVLRAGALVQ